MSRKWIAFALTIIVVVTGDIVTKALIVEHIAYRDGFSVIDGFFNIVHARNRGAAFGIFSNADSSWVMPFFLTIGTIALGFLLNLTRQVPGNRILIPTLLGAIGGGAIGNMIDRVRWGYVVDFLDFYVGRSHWPAFNVADMGISGGVTILLILSFLKKDDELFSGSPVDKDD